MFDYAVGNVCPFCSEAHIVEVRKEDYDAWLNGELIQNAMPYLTPDDREILISGICPDCWEKMFGE